ncbi:MAG: histidinol phosphatase [Chitinispirillaceae bacterium]|nr:histidinol phosphatase [Chitinispirillaceae bacterium]
MYSVELSTAINLVLRAGSLIRKSRQSNPVIDKKADSSPVTGLDRACEALIRNELLRAFARDAFLGEESGSVAGTSGRCWIVDPLDGTRPFIRNIPTYGTLIALEEDSVPVIGVINLPALNITCWAVRGEGAYLNGQPIRVSSTAVLEAAMGSALGFREHPQAPLREKLLECMRVWDYAYGFMDAFSYVCVASGRLDLCINLLDKPWDCAAAACIVTEAGGKYSDIRGAPSVHNGSIVFSNGLLHSRIIDFMCS